MKPKTVDWKEEVAQIEEKLTEKICREEHERLVQRQTELLLQYNPDAVRKDKTSHIEGEGRVEFKKPTKKLFLGGSQEILPDNKYGDVMSYG